MPDLSEWIEGQLKRGYSREQIKEALRLAGYSQDAIAIIVDDAESFEVPKHLDILDIIRYRYMPIIIKALIAGIVLSAVGITIFLLTRPEEPQPTIYVDIFNPEAVDLFKCTQNISDAELSNDCIIEAIAKEQKSLNVCDRMYELSYNAFYMSAEADKFKCYATVAAELEDETICEQISAQAAKDLCRQSVGSVKKGLAYCNGMASELKNLCYKDFAVRRHNVSACHQLSDSTQVTQVKRKCYAEVAAAMQNHSVCNHITPLYDRWICFGRVAGITKNPGICTEIGNESLKNRCYSVV